MSSSRDTGSERMMMMMMMMMTDSLCRADGLRLGSYRPPLSYAISRTQAVRAHTAKSKERNRIPGTNCTETAVCCVGFRGASVAAAEISDL
eukprot:3257285-Rhodomonas_salina.1